MLPNPATVAEHLFEEFLKETIDWDQVRQWVQECPDVCKEKDSKGCLPLHCACDTIAPLNVIQLLVEAWPDAVKEKDHDGDLPLHCACFKNASPDVIQCLVEKWPQSIHAMNDSGSTPLAYAKACDADIHTLSWLEAMESGGLSATIANE